MYLIFYGVTGKTAVAMCCVILGYFSYCKGDSGEATLLYTIKRYAYFVIAALIINSIYAVLGYIGVINMNLTAYQVLRSSILLSDDIQGRFWCLPIFLFGSFFSFINGKYKLSVSIIVIETMAFILIGQEWIAICLFGNLMCMFTENDNVKSILKHKWVQLLIIFIVFVLIKREESTLTYIIDGICSVALIMVVVNNTKLQAVLSNKYISKVNKNYMGVFLGHELVYLVIGEYIIHAFSSLSDEANFFLSFFLCTIVVIAFAYLLEFMINYCNKYFSHYMNEIWKKIAQLKDSRCRRRPPVA